MDELEELRLNKFVLQRMLAMVDEKILAAYSKVAAGDVVTSGNRLYKVGSVVVNGGKPYVEGYLRYGNNTWGKKPRDLGDQWEFSRV
jgi:hypothetical protein